MAASHHLGFVGCILDDPQRVLGGLYHSINLVWTAVVVLAIWMFEYFARLAWKCHMFAKTTNVAAPPSFAWVVLAPTWLYSHRNPFRGFWATGGGVENCPSAFVWRVAYTKACDYCPSHDVLKDRQWKRLYLNLLIFCYMPWLENRCPLFLALFSHLLTNV